jgi:hypothetical protein
MKRCIKVYEPTPRRPHDISSKAWVKCNALPILHPTRSFSLRCRFFLVVTLSFHNAFMQLDRYCSVQVILLSLASKLSVSCVWLLYKGRVHDEINTHECDNWVHL